MDEQKFRNTLRCSHWLSMLFAGLLIVGWMPVHAEGTDDLEKAWACYPYLYKYKETSWWYSGTVDSERFVFLEKECQSPIMKDEEAERLLSLWKKECVTSSAKCEQQAEKIDQKRLNDCVAKLDAIVAEPSNEKIVSEMSCSIPRKKELERDFKAKREEKLKLISEWPKKEKERKEKEHERQVKNGEIKPQSVVDILLLNEELKDSDLYSIVKHPLLIPDKKIYLDPLGVVKLDKQINQSLLRGRLIGNMGYVYINLNSKTTIFKPENLRIGSFIKIIGRYVGNESRSFMLDYEVAQTTAPIFDALFIE